VTSKVKGIPDGESDRRQRQRPSRRSTISARTCASFAASSHRKDAV